MLPESDSRLVVYQLVVPQLAVLRLPRRRIHVVRFSGDFSTVLLPEFNSTQHLAIPRRLPCAPVHLNTSEGIYAWRSRKTFIVGDTATTTPGPVHPFLPVKLLLRHTIVVSPALMFSLG